MSDIFDFLPIMIVFIPLDFAGIISEVSLSPIKTCLDEGIFILSRRKSNASPVVFEPALDVSLKTLKSNKSSGNPILFNLANDSSSGLLDIIYNL